MKKMLKTASSIPSQTFLYLFIASSIVCVFALRHNNQEMTKLRNEVYATDKKNGDIDKALNNLKQYVFSHMNTSLSSGNNNIKPPIQLKYTYQRLYEAQLDKIQTGNQKIYATAQKKCPANNAGYDPARLSCIQNYAINHGVKGADISVPVGLYQFDFLSPSWSPDLAGISLLAAILFLVLFLMKLAIDRLHKK